MASPEAGHLSKVDEAVGVSLEHNISSKHPQGSRETSPERPQLDAETRKKLLRKTDLLILPALGLGLLSHAIDQSNIGNAKSDTLERDLGLVDNQFTLILILFYIPLIICSIPFALLAKRFSPARVLPLAMVGFGVVATVVAGATNFGGLLACRMILGVLQAAFLPLPSYYGSLFYTRGELSFRIACFFSMANIAGAISGLISYAVFQRRSGLTALSGWQYLFIIEGSVAVGVSIGVFFVLPRSIESSRFFTPAEKKLARARLSEGTMDAEHGQHEDLEKFSWPDARLALLSWESWAYALMALSFGVALTGSVNFLPSIIKRLTNDAARANLFTIGPHLCAVVAQLGTNFLNDRIQQRGILIASFASVAAVAWLLLAVLDLRDRVDVGYFLTYLLMMGVFTVPALVAEWVASNSAESTGRAMRLGMFSTAIPLGGIFSSVAFRAQDAPLYQRGLLTCAAFLALLVVLAVGMRVHCAWMNGKMDRGELVHKVQERERPEWRYAI